MSFFKKTEVILLRTLNHKVFPIKIIALSLGFMKIIKLFNIKKNKNKRIKKAKNLLIVHFNL